MALAAGTRIGVYEVITLLGAGGMGEVYRARDTRLKREVALKTILHAVADDPDRVARFTREAEMLAALNHPNIAGIHGVEEASLGTAGGADRLVRALVMELVGGETVADRLKSGPIPTEEALSIARQIALALEAAHEQGIIHRDLKPANVKLREDGTVKVLDFGLAKLSDPIAAASGPSSITISPTITSPALMTNAGMLLGTAAYMSPEQAKGRPTDKRSDVWAFGCVLFEMLTGKRAFEGEDVSETLAAVLRGEPDWSALPADTPAALTALIRRCLERDKRRRIGDAAAALFVLDEHSKLLAAAPAPDRGAFQQELEVAVAATRDQARRRTHRLLAGAAAVAAVVVTASTAGVWYATRPAPPRVFRLAMVPSPGALPRVAPNTNDLAITSDGARVAFFVGNLSTGVGGSLAVQSLDEFEPLVLNNVTLAGAPFISPDSAWLGFWEQGDSTIKKIPIGGGAPVSIATGIPALRGATWTADDAIIFGTSGAAQGLRQVSSAGGTVTTVTEVTPGSGESHQWPQLLPGGRGLLFTSFRGATAANAQVEVMNLGTKERNVVATRGSYPRYSPSGHVVFAVDGTLFAVGFDLDTLTATTPPRAVLQGVVTKESGAADFDIAANGTLVYMPGSGSSARRLVLVDRVSQRSQPLPGLDAGDYRSVRVGPGGKRIVFEAGPEGNGKLWIYDVERRVRTQITTGEGDDRNPLWSPDGRIVFGSNREGKWGVFVVNADGTGAAERISNPVEAAELSPQSFSPDGKKLLVTVVSQGNTGADVVALDMTDGTWEPKLQTQFIETQGMVSPNGEFMAYMTIRTGPPQIFVERFPGMGERQQVSTGGGIQPLWSRDGSELFFMEPTNREVLSVSVGKDMKFGAPKTLIKGAYFQLRAWRTFDVMPDGQFLMIALSDAPSSDAAVPTPIVVQNWSEELKRLVPVD